MMDCDVGRDARAGTVGNRTQWRAFAEAREALGEQRYAELPTLPDLDLRILNALRVGGKLEMSSFHDEHCKTTHCIAGWAVVVAGVRRMERRARDKPRISSMGQSPGDLAAGLYQKAGLPLPDFFLSNERAMRALKRRAHAQFLRQAEQQATPQQVAESLVEA